MRQPTKKAMACSLKIVITALFFLLISGSASADQPMTPDKVEIASGLEVAPLSELAPGLKLGESVHIKMARLADDQFPVDLDLVRFEVFTSETEIHIYGKDGVRIEKAPANVYLRGKVVGDPSSLVVLSFHEDSSVRGLASWRAPEGGERISILEGPGANGYLRGEIVGPDYFKSDVGKFSCGADLLAPDQSEKKPLAQLVRGGASAQELDSEPASVLAVTHTARLAIETDYELYQKFNDTTTMINYIGNLFAYMSGIYEDQVNVNLIVTYLNIYETAQDPWDETTTYCALREFGKHWNDNQTGVKRTIAHFMSGKDTGGGEAWLGALCQKKFSTRADNCRELSATGDYGGDYGFTGSLLGTFNPGSPGVVWDIYGISHEIGHNFNSLHTHCYSGFGGSSEPIDRCWNEERYCYSGKTSLPGPQGQGTGTIMSYCHTMPGAYSNISLNFGINHAYGVLPERVANVMKAHVAEVAASNPTCLAHQYLLQVTKDGTGSGTVTSSPAGITCGATCNAAFANGTSVTLTATAPVGSAFTGWSGSGCLGTGACTVAMTQSRTVTATFNTVPTFNLTVTKNGPGAGTITSSPAGINCGGTCNATYNSGTSVTLNASAGLSSTFTGWSGAGCSGTGSCIVNMTQARSVTAAFAIINPWLIQKVCVDANDQTLPMDPFYGCGTGNTLRALRPGDRLPYHKYDAAYPGQVQRHDSYPLITPGDATIVVNPFAYGSSPTDSVLNQFKPGSGDGYDIYVVGDGWASASQTRNGGSFSTTFFSPGCKPYNGWLFFPSNISMNSSPGTTTSGIWGNNWEQNGENWPGICPSTYGSSQTDWYPAPNFPFGNTPDKTKTLNAMVVIKGYAPGSQLQVFYFTELYGVTRWEVWTPAGQNPVPGNFSCNGSRSYNRYGVDFTVTACRDWSSVNVLAVPNLPAVWPVPDQNLLQNFHFGTGITPWQRSGNSAEGNLINWSLLNSTTPLDSAHSQTGSGVRYLATNCSGTCTGQQMIYQDVTIDGRTPSGNYTLAVTARTQGTNPGTLKLSLLQLSSSTASVGTPVSFEIQASPTNQPSVVLGSLFLRGSVNLQLAPDAQTLRFAITPMTSHTFDIVDAWLMRNLCTNVNAGIIWNNPDAQNKCPNVCSQAGAQWNGQWTSTVPGVMSVCGCCQ